MNLWAAFRLSSKEVVLCRGPSCGQGSQGRPRTMGSARWVVLEEGGSHALEPRVCQQPQHLQLGKVGQDRLMGWLPS